MGKSPSHKKTHVVIPKWAILQDRLAKKHYPNCRGTFPDCPKIINEQPAQQCLTCPFYK
ncbi:MAG: hypothetical protein QXE31_03355 [Candidatus Woesearchaeota archaeon]